MTGQPAALGLSLANGGRVRVSSVVSESAMLGSLARGAHAPLAQWRWSDELASSMAGAGTRSYCCQYRESDLNFVARLLTEEGLAWRVEENDDGEGGHSVVLFAESSDSRSTPQDPSSAVGGGIRFHDARAGEAPSRGCCRRGPKSISTTWCCACSASA